MTWLVPCLHFELVRAGVDDKDLGNILDENDTSVNGTICGYLITVEP